MKESLVMNKKCKSILGALLLVSLLLAGISCSTKQVEVKSSDVVQVHYTGRLLDGTVFDTSIGGEPMEFTVGSGQLIPGFEQAVIGMQVGELKTVTIPVDEAYGERRDDMILEVDRSELPDDLVPEVGMQLQMYQSDGAVLIVTITEVTETTITIDANHALAGKDLIFDIELVAIGQSSSTSTLTLAQALANGKPTLAEFGSNSCIPCKQMKPILNELATEYQGKVNVVIIEVYDNMALTRQYGIMAIPTQIIFDTSGKEVMRHTGLWSREQITEELKGIGIE
jgi:FKBP-type peptidyl-prolyl cis-trans isomerase 2